MPTFATAPLPDAFSIPQPGIPQPGIVPGIPQSGIVPGIPQPGIVPGIPQPGMTSGIPQPGMAPEIPQPGTASGIPQPGTAPGIPQPGMAPGISQPGMAPGIPRSGMAPGIPQPGMAPGIPRSGMAPGIPQPGMAPGIPRSGMAPGIPQPGMAPGIPQPGMAPGIPRSGMAPGIPRSGMAPGIPQPGMAPGIPQPGMAPGIPQPGMAPGIPRSGMAPGISRPAPPPYGISMPGPEAPQPMMPQGGWSPRNTTCPPGLEYLIVLDRLYIRQQLELLEVVVGWETENKYFVTNTNGQPLFYIMEESNICARLCLGTLRNCVLHVDDTNHREVLRMVRPCRCSGCCCFCCMQMLEVYSGEMLLGSVIEDCHIFRPSFSIRDAFGETVLKITGPYFRFCGNATYKIKSADGLHRVGEIKKKWSGFTTEIFTDADDFSLHFPMDLDVKIKAVLLGACILIDFMYFEGNTKRNSI
ncbi:phospholipid scramblase 3 [Bombus huntii]|uniref:phospholipid scramblase 3 n=1 Tax=Bombus huntii TaxID=85661 RepID=UPI0021A9C9E8|nr:phospholipid scramblase 3 [Bombus huntii]